MSGNPILAPSVESFKNRVAAVQLAASTNWAWLFMFLICTASSTAPAVFILEFYAHLLHLSHDRRWFLLPALLHLCPTLPAAPTRDDHARQYSIVRFCALLEERERGCIKRKRFNFQKREMINNYAVNASLISTAGFWRYSKIAVVNNRTIITSFITENASISQREISWWCSYIF